MLENSRRLLLAALLILPCIAARAADQATPSHIYQQAMEAVRLVEMIREHEQVTDHPAMPPAQVHKQPVQVFVKVIEVAEKLSLVQTRLGTPASARPVFPARAVETSDALAALTHVVNDLDSLRDGLGIDPPRRALRFVPRKTLADAYEALWLASNMLDGLAGPTSAARVRQRTRWVLAEIDQVARHLGRDLPPPAAIRGQSASALESNLEAYKNLHRMDRVERNVGVPPVRVPMFPGGEQTYADVFDTTSLLLAELHRVRVSIGDVAPAPAPDVPVGDAQSGADPYADLQLIGRRLVALAADSSS